MWLNPYNPNTCPPELLEAFRQEASTDVDEYGLAFPDASGDDLDSDSDADLSTDRGSNKRTRRDRRGGGAHGDEANVAARLRAEMQKDALHTYEELGELVETGSSAFGTTARTTDPKGKRRKGDDDDDFSNEADTLVFSKDEVATAREFLGLAVRWPSTSRGISG